MTETAGIHPVILYSIADIAEGACSRCFAAENPVTAKAHRSVLHGELDGLTKRYKKRGIDVLPTVDAMKQTCADCLKDQKPDATFASRVGCIIRGGLE